MSEPRRYHIQAFAGVTPDRLFWTGTSSDEPRILGAYRNTSGTDILDELVCCCFDTAGVLREVLIRPLARSASAEPVKQNAVPLISETLTQGEALDQLQQWAGELGIAPGPVSVQQFRLPDRRIYIRDHADWGIILQNDPFYYPTRKERDQMRRQLAEWDKAGNFVVWWGEDYSMNAEGEVFST